MMSAPKVFPDVVIATSYVADVPIVLINAFEGESEQY
jgi:hypothetical protein